MKHDSISASSKIKELFELHRSGRLSIEDYHNQLRSWIMSQLRMSPSEKSKESKESVKIPVRYIPPLTGESDREDNILLRSGQIEKIDDQPTKEKVEKILWTLLN